MDKAPSKSSVSYQNKNRTHELFKEYYFTLLQSLGQHPKFKQIKFRIKSKILLFDSTTISLCLSIFDWAKYKTNKGAVKMHTLLDFDGNLPAYINITDGKIADNKGAYDIPLLKGSVIVADCFYNDFSLLNIWDSKLWINVKSWGGKCKIISLCYDG
ncbi:transposase [Myroides odoratimimus]|nr:transposase [Myroides odoratimimus]